MEPIRLLTSDDMARIDEAAQTILERTGMVIDLPEAREYLRRFGCTVDAANRVRFPAPLVREVAAKMRRDYAAPGRPARMPVRFSHVRFRAERHQVHPDFTVSAGGFLCFIHDFDGHRRPANGHDVRCALNLVNHLDQIDLTGLPVADQTIPAPQRPVRMAAELITWTRKIGGIETFCKEDVGFVCELAQIAAGSSEAFRREPALVGYAEVRSPLCFDRNMVEIFLEYLKRGVPQTVDTMPCGGTTAPVTPAGILALGAAETLAAVVLAYAVRDDAVVGMDVNPSCADMSSGLFRYSGAERLRLLMARIQLLSEYYGCPTGVHGGKTDSCFLNEQAGAEKMSSMLLPVLAGAVGIGTVGAIENAVTFSPVQLVIDNEMARYTRHALVKPFMVTPETLATEVIDAVGPGGNFLETMHTAERFREELLQSPLFPALPWEAARRAPERADMVTKAAAMAQELWQPAAVPVLSDSQLQAVAAVVRRAGNG